MTLKKLPLGNQLFSEIIDDNFLYADKTKYLYDLLTGPSKHYALSRPRRFGKTLLLDTLMELFSGEPERFKGLWIGQTDYTFPNHPVIYLSMSISSSTTKNLKESLLSTLNRIPEEYNLFVKKASPDVYFESIIRALQKKTNSEVVILIDEYDSPINWQMDNLEVATANAKFLHNFFATLLKPDITPYIRFSFLTGKTIYAIPPLDTGANHFNDITLDPNYAGICGFTLEEFDSLFEDRMEMTLENLKKTGGMEASASILDFRKVLAEWFDGYNWGGQSRVLNPHSILNFFDNFEFEAYWFYSGLLGHLEDLIEANPQDSISPNRQEYSSTEIKNIELSKLHVVPALFYKGYLTIDKIKPSQDGEYLYTFKLPNYEISFDYYIKCTKIIYGINLYGNEFCKRGKKLKEAILQKDVLAVSSIFRDFFSSITTDQTPTDYNSFHSFVQLLLFNMDLTIVNELPGVTEKLDLCLELEDKVFVIIKLMYCQDITELTQEEETLALAKTARVITSRKVRDKYISNAVHAKISDESFRKFLSDFSPAVQNKAKKLRFIANVGRFILSTDELKTILANLVREKCHESDIKKILRRASELKLTNAKKIKQRLTEALHDVLSQIKFKDYESTVKVDFKKIIFLGIAISPIDFNIEATFGPTFEKENKPITELPIPEINTDK
ncbi:MAG: AAA family ATPase [Deltaproteobacteria bacterium]|jgi:hypothetical protein|nr:AAA family ATPase [Deltaproteobacteria bacterium]